MKRLLKGKKGFTLAELLIALAILGVIATFTIPKVLSASNDSQSKSIAKEIAGMLSGSYQAYSLDNTISTGTTLGSLTSYMNYVKVVATSNAATGPMNGGSPSFDCSVVQCLLLHSGAIIGYLSAQTFATTGSYMTVSIDPDGTKSALGPSSFVLYYNGRLTTGENATGAIGTGGMTLVGTDLSYMNF